MLGSSDNSKSWETDRLCASDVSSKLVRWAVHSVTVSGRGGRRAVPIQGGTMNRLNYSSVI